MGGLVLWGQRLGFTTFNSNSSETTLHGFLEEETYS